MWSFIIRMLKKFLSYLAKEKQYIYKYFPCLHCGKVISNRFSGYFFCSEECRQENNRGTIISKENYYKNWKNSQKIFEKNND